MAELQMFDNGDDMVIATSPEEATRIMCEHLGERISDYESATADWRVKRHDTAVCIWLDTAGNISAPGEPGAHMKTAPVADWISRFGNGFYASRNA